MVIAGRSDVRDVHGLRTDPRTEEEAAMNDDGNN